MRRGGLLVAASSLALALLGVLSLGRGRSAEPRRGPAETATTSETDHAPEAIALATAPRRMTASAPSVAPGGAGEDHQARLTQRAERVSHAIALLRYPPGSQPLSRDMRDVLKPNARHETALPLALATGATGGAPTSGELSFQLTGDVYTVVGRGSLSPTLEVFRESTPGSERARVAVDITDLALVTVEPGGTRPVATTLALNDEGRTGDAVAGDRIYGTTIVPSAIPALAAYRGLARLDVGFVAREGDRRPAHATLDFRVIGSAPAAFIGVSNERLTAEGLELSVDLDVDEPGHYFVQGLLFDAHGAPIGFAVARPTLARGRATVPLLYFGLLFHDARASGPFVFRTLTGQRLPEANEPDRAELAMWLGSYQTRAYRLTELSDREYESPAKEAKIQALAALAARKGGGR